MTHIDQMFGFLADEDRHQVAEDVRPAVEGRGDYRSQFRAIWPDGSLHWIDAWGRTVFSDDGKPIKIVGVNVDITERKLSEGALLQNEKLAAVGRLASSIAHEINNPLEAVTNLLYLAKRSDSLPEALGYLDSAETELRRTSAITSQTLRFHRQSTRPSEVAAQELFESVLMIHHSRIINARVTVESEFRSSRSVSCFDGEVRQVLNNFVTNAIDAMIPNGGRLILRTRDRRDWSSGEAGVIFTIADTGPGIPKETLDKIFNAFFTTKGIGGTGLGLWISKDIIARHHGRVSVRSRVSPNGHGTVFAIFLPFDAAKRTT